MAASIRKAKAEDLLHMHACNLMCFSEGEIHPLQHHSFLFLTWPHLQHVAQALDGRIVGYVLAMMKEDEEGGIAGRIISIAVSRHYRRCGLATKLMNAAHAAMIEVYEAEYVYLHVRKSNRAALDLFTKTLGYTEHKLEKEKFADGEDGWFMQKLL